MQKDKERKRKRKVEGGSIPPHNSVEKKISNQGQKIIYINSETEIDNEIPQKYNEQK